MGAYATGVRLNKIDGSRDGSFWGGHFLLDSVDKPGKWAGLSSPPVEHS